jgi:uncharacterized membrane protein YdbT with pleckstrin-like domain
MKELQQEITLAKVRLHWGVFIPVLLFAFGPLVALLPLIFILHGFLHSLTQMEMRVNQSPSIGSLNVTWLLPLVPYLVIVIGLLLGTWFSYLKSEVTLTNRRLLFRTGFLSRRSGEVPLENVEAIYISEPLIGRMFGYGTVMVTTVGGARFPLAFIGSPQSFHSALQQAALDAKESIRGDPKPPGSGPPPRDGGSRYKPER